MSELDDNRQVSTLELQKWEAERGFRERELALKEREQNTRDADLDLRRKDQALSGWRNPLVVAVFAAAIGAAGNAMVTYVNGVQQRALEEQKSEQARLLEMIRTGNPDKAAENLRFLVDAGLVIDPRLVASLRDFLAKRQPGSGPALPSQATGGPLRPAISARDMHAVLSAYSIMSDGLRDGRTLLAQLSLTAPSRQEERQINSLVTRLGLFRADLQVGYLAFVANQQAGRPPSEKELQELQTLTKEIQDSLSSVSAKDKNELLRLAKELIHLCESVRLFNN